MTLGHALVLILVFAAIVVLAAISRRAEWQETNPQPSPIAGTDPKGDETR
jgi:hypothetical protein